VTNNPSGILDRRGRLGLPRNDKPEASHGKARRISPHILGPPSLLWFHPRRKQGSELFFSNSSLLPIMHSISIFRLAALLTVTALTGSTFAAPPAPATPFQPLNRPATKEHLPGKFVWADLFTTDPVAATKFYSGLFGWTANSISQGGKTYTVFSNGSRPVAGLAPRPRSNTKRLSRWISYVAVEDVDATIKRVTKAGGQVYAQPREFPDRGIQAIVADSEGSSIGLLQSSSGDSLDEEPKAGDWNWFELFVKQPQATAAFYQKVLNYEMAPDTRTQRKNDYLLSSGGLARAGVAPLPEREDAKAGWLGVVRVDNMDQALVRVTKLGGEVLLAPRPAEYESRFAIIADSTGGAIGLVEYVNNANPAQRP
jgi:predicted enzyme related to lactoylglutathione lyase